MRPIFFGRETLIAGAFGLVHGMAFSLTLSALDLTGSRLVLSLLGFNLGVEIMQLVVVALVLPPLVILAGTRTYPYLRAGAATSGAPLEHTEGQPSRLDTTVADPLVADPSLLEKTRNSKFELGDDRDGAIVPLAAHVRKAQSLGAGGLGDERRVALDVLDEPAEDQVGAVGGPRRSAVSIRPGWCRPQRGLVIILLESAMAWWLAGRLVRPLATMADTANQIADGSLDTELQPCDTSGLPWAASRRVRRGPGHGPTHPCPEQFPPGRAHAPVVSRSGCSPLRVLR